MFVRDADEAVCSARRAGRRHRSATSTTRRSSARCVAARADAVVGRLGLRGRAARVRRPVRAAGHRLRRARTRRSCGCVGDKIAAKRLAEEAGVPVAPWSGGPVETVEEALRHADAHRLPADDQGRRRRRRARHPPRRRARTRSPPRSRAPAPRPQQAFGDGTVLLERLVTPARHIEVQVIADGQGAAWAVGVRDCSCQRRNQKVIEESASPALTAEQEREVLDGGAPAGAARRLPQRRHRRVPLRAGRRAASRSWRSTPACRSSTPSPRRSPGSTSSSCSCTSPPAAGWRASRRPPTGHADRGAPERRGPGARLRARARADRAAAPARPAPACASTPASPRATSIPRRVRLDDRQGHRLGPRPRRGARAAAPRARRDDGRRRRRHDQPGLPARAARPPRGARRRASTRRGWTACSCSGEHRPGPPRRRRAAAGGDRAQRRARRPPTARASTRSPAAAARRPTRASARTVELRHRGQAYRCAGQPGRPGPPPRDGRRRVRRGPRPARRPATSAGWRSRGARTAR